MKAYAVRIKGTTNRWFQVMDNDCIDPVEPESDLVWLATLWPDPIPEDILKRQEAQSGLDLEMVEVEIKEVRVVERDQND